MLLIIPLLIAKLAVPQSTGGRIAVQVPLSFGKIWNHGRQEEIRQHPTHASFPYVRYAIWTSFLAYVQHTMQVIYIQSGSAPQCALSDFG